LLSEENINLFYWRIVQ